MTSLRFRVAIVFLLLCSVVRAEGLPADSLQKPDAITATTDTVIVPKVEKKPNFIKRILTQGLNLNFVAAPVVTYQPETSWAFGVVGGYYFRQKNADKAKTSLITFRFLATLAKQYECNISSNVYAGKNQEWLLYLKAEYKDYADKFYGVGNAYHNLLLDEQDNISPLSFFYKQALVNFQPQRRVGQNMFLGLNLNFRYEEPKGLPAEWLSQRYNVVGFDRYTMLGLGLQLAYDTRDNVVCSSRGLFAKLTATHFLKLKNPASLNKLQADFRHFLPIYRELSFAYQLYADMTLPQKHERPFQMLPTFGGTDIMRGFRTNMWKDDISVAAQAELRIPIWRMFRAVVFSNIGDVYSWQDMRFVKPKVGYGAGLRVQFNQEKANIRFDVARQNYDNQWYFYINVNEAF